MKPETQSHIRHVWSGDYITGGKKNEKLEANLATCVGVTLCDKKAMVGGLIHLLLPEPPGLNRPANPVAYATTGMPLFIKALRENGASRDHMEACIAGGALVGPMNSLDLDLDIGGRTAEVVNNILRKERIPVVKSETGGCFCCRLGFDMDTFKSAILPIIDQPLPAEEGFKKPGINKIVDSISLVQPIPQIALKIARMAEEGDYDIAQVAGEIKQDQVISARIIAMSNSSFMGLRKKIDSIERALVVLGEKLILQMVLSVSLELYFSNTLQGYSLCKGGLFKHAMGTAMVCEKLALYTGKAPTEVAYAAGLLHDIGKIVLDQYIAEAFPFFYRRTQMDRVDICRAEDEKLGITHPEVGGLLAENWSLPENLTEAIRHHHHPESAAKAGELTHLVYLADLLMTGFQAEQGLRCLNTDNLSSRLQTLGLTTSQFPMLVDLIPKKIFRDSH